MTGYVVTPCLGCLQETWLPAPPPESIRRRLLSMPRAVLLVCGGSGLPRQGARILSARRATALCCRAGACGVDADRTQWTRMRGADRLVGDWCILHSGTDRPLSGAGSVIEQRLLLLMTVGAHLSFR